MRINRRNLKPIIMAVVILTVFNVTYGQDAPPQQPVRDMIEQLQLTPEQRQKIRAIREETRNERTLVNQRLREANQALQQALDADTLDEALIEQRLKDAVTAQAASTRMRIQTELKIRRVLTQEQVATLRDLRLQASRLLRDQQMQNQRQNRRALVPPRRDGIAPVLPRRNPLRRNRPF